MLNVAEILHRSDSDAKGEEGTGKKKTGLTFWQITSEITLPAKIRSAIVPL